MLYSGLSFCYVLFYLDSLVLVLMIHELPRMILQYVNEVNIRFQGKGDKCRSRSLVLCYFIIGGFGWCVFTIYFLLLNLIIIVCLLWCGPWIRHLGKMSFSS